MEIGICSEDEEELRKVTIFENDEPYCYTKMGSIYIDKRNVIVCMDGINFITPANKMVDLNQYTLSKFKE